MFELFLLIMSFYLITLLVLVIFYLYTTKFYLPRHKDISEIMDKNFKD